MSKASRITLTAVVAIICLIGQTAVAQETVKTRIGDLRFSHDFANGYPTDDSVDKLFNELDFQRACQVYLWSLPIVSMAQ